MKKYQRLVALLIKKTHDGTARWEQTSREGVFALSLPDYSVWISTTRNDTDPNTNDVFFQIVNSSGNIIDRFRDWEISEGIDDKGNFYKTLEELYQNARRVAFGVDKVLDKLLEELGKD